MAISSLFARWRDFRALAFSIFSLTAFVIHVWTILNMFWDIPSWLLRMNLAELAGAIGYTLLFALAESFLISAPLIIMGFFLPSGWRTERYLSLCFVLLLVTALAAILLHNFEELWLNKRLLAAAWVLSLSLLGAVVLRFGQLRSLIVRFTGRLGLLVSIYLVGDLFAVLIVVARNL